MGKLRYTGLWKVITEVFAPDITLSNREMYPKTLRRIQRGECRTPFGGSVTNGKAKG